MKKVYIFFLLLLPAGIFAQNSETERNNLDLNYYGEWGFAPYDTLTEYTSILYDIFSYPSLYWNDDPEIQIGFTFPFFDTDYTSLHINGGGYVWFGLNWNEIYCYSAFYERHTDLPIFSDWRYRLDTVGKKILKFEWRNVGFLYDLQSSNPTDHRLNFQLWLHEDGIIEYRFGEIDLANTPLFSIERGFQLPTGETFGPWVFIVRRELEEEHYFVLDEAGQIEYLNTGPLGGDIYHGIPEYGRYFKFIPNEVVSSNSKKADPMEGFRIVPNPVAESFRLGLAHPENPALADPELVIYNSLGKQVYSKKIRLAESIDVAHLPAGCYYVSLIGKGTKYNTTMIKK